MTCADPVPGDTDPTLPLLFVHIPRTGGTTLNFLLRRTLGVERTLLAAHWYRTNHHDLRGFAFVEGHLGSEFFARKFGAGWCANGVTMLRDPVARTVSQARHIRAIPGPFQEYLGGKVRAPAEVFERIPQLINLQTKQLSRAPLDATYVGAGALDEAKATLDRLAFGLTEAFDSSIALLMERLRFGVPFFEDSNVSQGTHDDDLLCDQFRATAREHNDLDQRLYDHAATLLRSRLASYTDSLLELPTENAPLTCGLRFRREQIECGIRLPCAEVEGKCTGWVLVDGRSADAVLVRVGERVIPLIPRVERTDAARQTQDLDNRNAGVVGTVVIPPDARSVELIAFDRTRNLRATRELEINRVSPDPLVARLPAALKNRVKKALRP